MEETMKISTEDIRIYAKALRLSNLRNNCGDIIHKAQIDKPSYMDFIMDILKAETASRQQNDLVRRMRQAKLPRNCDLDRFDFNHSAGITKPQLKQLRELVWLDQMYRHRQDFHGCRTRQRCRNEGLQGAVPDNGWSHKHIEDEGYDILSNECLQRNTQVQSHCNR